MNTVSVHPSAVEGCVEACRRCRDFLAHVTPAQYAGGGGIPAIGSHMRHCLDHFSCLLGGLESGEVDYDARERDESIEREPDRFVAALAAVVQTLAQWDAEVLRRRIRVRQMAAPDQEPVCLETTVERELLFLSGHTIHHLATATQLARLHGVTVPEELSVAFSTAAHCKALRAAK